MYFNQNCLRKNIIPNYVQIKIPNTSPALNFTQHKASITILKGEIK